MFQKFAKMEGRFSNKDGYYVEYHIEENKLTSKYSLPFEGGDYFLLKDGVHYHSEDGKIWEKQWIYEKISSNIVRPNVAPYESA